MYQYSTNTILATFNAEPCTLHAELPFILRFTTLKEKRVLKLKLLDQKGTWHYFGAPGAVPPDKRAPFSKTVPQGHHFSQNSALSLK